MESRNLKVQFTDYIKRALRQYMSERLSERLKSYCGVLLDNNNRKPICRMRFNSKTAWKLGLFSEDKTEEMVSIETLDDIYKYADRIRAKIDHYKD